MEVRTTQQTMLSNALANLAQQTSRQATLQQQASTGKKLLLPSDDPAALQPLLAAKSEDSRLESYLGAIRESRSVLDSGVAALTEAGNILSKARTVAIEASHSGNDATALKSMAQEVDSLLNRLLGVANTQLGDRYLFAGAASQTRPFVVSAMDSEGRPSAVAYQGGSTRDAVPVARQQTVATLYAGATLFQSSANADAFQALMRLRDHLRNTGGLSEKAQLESISQDIDYLDRARGAILAGVGEQSASLQHLENLEKVTLEAQLAARKVVSDLEDADVSEVVVRLQENENLLRLAFAASARLFDQSLLDYLR